MKWFLQDTFFFFASAVGPMVVCKGMHLLVHNVHEWSYNQTNWLIAK